MNEQRAASLAKTRGSLHDSPRNTSSDHIRHWSQPSTIPLRFSKQESPLTYNPVPNPRYHKLPSQLARRQSSSYNHVRNNALVSNSPFKVGTPAKASRIPAPSRSQTSPEDENKPELGGYHRRQSKGLHVLAKEQVVTKSPFRSDKDICEPKPERPERGRSLTPTQPPVPSLTVASPAQLNRTEPDVAYSSNVPPRPTTPRNPRTMGTSNMEASSSPKSVLVSPKRLHGPRSLSASPGSELKAQRRKTVTFVELIDVLEFDKDEVSDAAYSSADEYGSPDNQSPSMTSCENSFDSSVSEILLMHPPEESDIINDRPLPRPPYISGDDVRRRLLEQRREENEEAENSFTQTLSDTSLASTSSQYTQTPSVSADLPEEVVVRPSMTPVSIGEINPPMDLECTSSTSDLQAALDSLILGVEKELMVNQRENLEPDSSIDFGEISQNHLTNIEGPESGSTDEDNDEPATPREHTSQLPHLSMENVNDADAVHDSLSTLTEKSLRSFLDKSEEIDSREFSVTNMSMSGLHMTSKEIETSSPPRKDSLPSVNGDITGASSLTLPPLLFDESLHSSSSWNMDLDASSSKLTQTDLDDTSHINPSLYISANAAPPVPPKDDSTIERTEEQIQVQPRELRQDRQRPVTYHEGRPSRRRSLSTGDAEDFHFSNQTSQRRAELPESRHDPTLLNHPVEQLESDRALSEVIDQELKLRRKPTVKEQYARNKLYKLRERVDTIYASSEDRISHSRQAGDVDAGKAWKTVRRPSDMNEHSQLVKQYRAQQKPGKAYGKVFVRVLGIRKLDVPMPNEPTAFTCTLNNGIHFVTTPECRIGRDARIEQEFELIEHSKLEFKLTLKVHRTPEIEAQTKANNTLPMSIPVAPPPPPPPPPPSSTRNVRSFFGVGSSPKKHHKIPVVAAIPQAPQVPRPVFRDNFARYLKPDGTLAQTLVSFKEIASRCDTRIFETSFPLIGQRTTGSGKSANVTPRTIGEIVLKIFRLPPLPGIPNDQLPQSLDECHRGLQYTSWHKVTYHEGVLTQNGGDCRTWRRRLLRVIGSNLVAYNDVTKKATASIDLKKAVAVEDDDMTSLLNVTSRVKRVQDEFNDVYKIERSFRLIFPDEEEITFFADTDEAKQTWLNVLRALVGHIPPNPLWAELAWQRQEEMRRQDSLATNNANDTRLQ